MFIERCAKGVDGTGKRILGNANRKIDEQFKDASVHLHVHVDQKEFSVQRNSVLIKSIRQLVGKERE